ncbi:MAG: YcxB family protein [Ruminococcaceae bacterium]|nr:YcxB family protein [Oscillospiraceae bacterium]
MKILKNIASVLLAILLISTFSVGVCADTVEYEYSAAGMTLNVPEEAYVITPQMSIVDDIWDEAGIKNPSEALNYFKDLGAVFQISMNENTRNIYMTVKTSDETEAYYNLMDLDEAQMAEFVAGFEGANDSESTVCTAKEYKGGKYPFVKVDIVSDEVLTGQTYYEIHYLTVINGSSYSLNAHDEVPLTDETIKIMEEMVNSITFKNILPTPDRSITNGQKALFVFLVILLVAFIVIVIKNRMKAIKAKKMMKVFADRLADFRSNESKDKGEVLFYNETDHDKVAIHQYANFFTYRKNLAGSVFAIGISVIGLIFSVVMEMEWWITFIFMFAALFCTYRFATAAKNTEKSLRKYYSKQNSTIAKYTFYENEFAVAGTQSYEVYPYFQITEIAEYQDYFYIYFGSEIVNYVAKFNFREGDPAAFKAFIDAKLKENKVIDEMLLKKKFSKKK